MSTATSPQVSITASEVQQRKSSKNSVALIDIRTAIEFEEIHAEGAVSVPLSELTVDRLKAIAPASSGECVYLICRSGARADQARAKLAAEGISSAVCVAGGMDAWQAAGLPVVRNRRIISLERQVRIAAGVLVLTGVALGYTVHPGFYGLSAFVGAGLVFAGITNFCGMGLLLAEMPWNRRPNGKTS